MTPTHTEKGVSGFLGLCGSSVPVDGGKGEAWLTGHHQQRRNIRVYTKQDIRLEVIPDHDRPLGIKVVPFTRPSNTSQHNTPRRWREREDVRSHDGLHHMPVRLTDDRRCFLG